MGTCTEQTALNRVLEKISVRSQEIQEERKLKMKESKNTHQKHASCLM